MEREAAESVHDRQVAPSSPTQHGGEGGVVTRKPGGKDALGKKENVLSDWFDEMVAVAHELAPKFTPLGLHFRPEVLLATAMQEASASNPLGARSFDNGLGIMQITPSKTGQLDANVAKAIGWDNSKSIEYNVQHSRWRDAKSNLTAGAHTMLGKAASIKSGVPKVWAEMDETHRWRAVLFAYNAGQGSAIKALKNGGPNAPMISTYTVNGKRVSHDYTKEISAKMDYVEDHDPFGEGGAPPKQDDAKDDAPDKNAPAGGNQQDHLKSSVGRGGANQREDVRHVQQRLAQRGVDPGPVDSLIGPKTIDGIEDFQSSFLSHPDGLISPGKTTEKHLFEQSGKVPAGNKDKNKDDGGGERHAKKPENTKEPSKDDEHDHPSYEQIAKNFHTGIGGTSLTWHQALWLPSWGRHAKPSDCTNTSFSTILSNIEKQAHALQKMIDHIGKAISVHCWLRPPAYNKQIGGAGNSAHLRGMATDFHINGMSAESVRQKVRGHKEIYPGAGENNVTWVHLDLEHSTWFNP